MEVLVAQQAVDEDAELRLLALLIGRALSHGVPSE